ncbi:MAG: hypothetical protein LBK59_00110 [Bifidobacteriaceae bacterium]|jgi:hypothetical protein|nr:hypothetical protein [Bifidobacteriaceae bacterium]
MKKDQGTRVWLGHLAALGLGLIGLFLAAQLVASALGGFVLGTLSGFLP